MGFAQPAEPTQGDKFDLKAHPEWEGGLALVFPTAYNEPRVWSDKFKDPTASVSADVVILDRIDPATGQPVQLHNTMIFGKVMVVQIKANMDNGDTEILGRIGKVPAKVGDFAWKFLEFNPGDEATADAWIRSHPRNSFAQAGVSAPPHAGAPAATAPQSQPNPWDLPAAPPAPAPQAPATGGWGAPPASAPAAPVPLRDYLITKGVDVNVIPDQATAVSLAMTYGGVQGRDWV